jgi:hypothetical protein
MVVMVILLGPKIIAAIIIPGTKDRRKFLNEEGDPAETLSSRVWPVSV